MKLPNTTGLTVAVDTEGSGLFPDDGARISAVSAAWRDPATHQIQAFATPFDQGLFGTNVAGHHHSPLPCGEKILPSNHLRRVNKLIKDHGDEIMFAPNRSPAQFDRLLDWLGSQRLIMHHKKYDCHMFWAGLRWNHPHVQLDALGTDLMPLVSLDTMLANGVIDPQHRTSLKPTAVRLHLGRDLGMSEGSEAEEQAALTPWKGPQKDPRFDLIPWSVLGPYARTDAILTLLLAEHRQAQLTGEDPDTILYRRLLARQEQLSRVLYDMERAGIGFDSAWCATQDALLTKLIKEATTDVPFRPTYPGAQQYFFGASKDGGLGLLPFNDKITGTGRGQVDEDVIARLIKLDTPGASEFQSLMALKSAQSKWFTPYRQMTAPDGRIRTSYSQGRVVTGRLSAERFQSQAIPHDYQMPDLFTQAGGQPIRYGFDPRPLHELWEADVSQAEIRVATRLAKCSPMLRAIKAGIDSHAAAALLMFYPKGTPISEAMADPDWEFNRGVPAKRSNLGILYGGGVGAIHSAILKFAGLDLDHDLIREWISDWRRAFPPFVRALDSYADLAARQGWVRLIDGQRRYFSEWEPVHKAFNAVIQNSVAVAIEYAMIEFSREFPGMLILQIHDSLVAEIPTPQVPHVTARMQQILVRNFERLFRPVPFKADIKPFGRTYYDRAERTARARA